MSPSPPIVPTFAPSRSAMLAASFAGCGGLLLILFVVLVGCGQLLTLPPDESVAQTDINAVLCSCECDGFFDPVPPSEVTIGVSEDDGTQVFPQDHMTLNLSSLALGQSNNVGLRFHRLGIPRNADINSARIQFSAFQVDKGVPVPEFDIFVVDSGNAEAFTAATDLRDGGGVNLILPSVKWTPGDWLAINDRGDDQKTSELAALVKKIVDHDGYTHDSAIAFVIRGSGRRLAKSYDGSGGPASGKPPTLTVVYTPKKITQDILTCGDVNDKQNVCEHRLQTVVSGLANMCKLSHTCTCKVKAAPDPTQFSAVCNEHNKPGGCLPTAPESCDPAHIAKATVATPADQPVCVASSPVGSVLFGQTSACEIDEATSTVFVRAFKGSDSVSDTKSARGRIEFDGKPCPGESCGVGMRHRMTVRDMTFQDSGVGGFLDGKHVLTDLSGVGASSIKASVDTFGAGQFGIGWTKHSVRGREEGSDPVAVFKSNGTLIDVGLDGWRQDGLCTVDGRVLQTDHVEMIVHLKGKLVNQPPTAAIDPEYTVECNATGRALFALDAFAHDPDNNVASFGWYRDSRTGPLVGTLPSAELDQPLGTTSYVFKVIDTFGQYAEATTKVSVVDTTKPIVTAPPKVTAECTGPTGTPVALGDATASDVCDASVVPGNDAAVNFPLGFPLGSSTVTWTATDDSGNKGSATQTVLIEDTTAPVLTVALSPAVLWPPDHKLVPITATITVKDTCDPNPTVRLVSITSSEKDNGLGDGDTSGDIQGATFGTDDRTFLLRSERSGPGGGRVYTVTYEASDASGNTTTVTATVTVPKNQSAKP